MTVRYATATRTARAQQVVTALGSGGKLKVYSGSQPASPQTAVSGTLLATLTLSATAGTVTNGVLTFGTIGSDTNAANSGVPGWATLTTSADARIVDMSAGVGSGELNFSANIVQTGTAACSSLVLTDGSP